MNFNKLLINGKDLNTGTMAEAIDEEDPAEELRSTASEWFGSLLKSTANLK